MTKQEQIEEMTKITCQMYRRDQEKKCAGVQECDMKCLQYQRCEALYNTGYHKPEWISVEDRLPEVEKEVREGSWCYKKSIRVLCACKQKSGKRMVKEGYCQYFESGKTYWAIPGSIDEVTHWMYIPELPDEK